MFRALSASLVVLVLLLSHGARAELDLSNPWVDLMDAGKWTSDGTLWVAEFDFFGHQVKEGDMEGPIVYPVSLARVGMTIDTCTGKKARYYLGKKKFRKDVEEITGRLLSKKAWLKKTKALKLVPGIGTRKHSGAEAKISGVSTEGDSDFVSGESEDRPDFMVLNVQRGKTSVVVGELEWPEPPKHKVTLSWSPTGTHIVWVTHSWYRPDGAEDPIPESDAHLTRTKDVVAKLVAPKSAKSALISACRQLEANGLGPIVLGRTKQVRSKTVVYSRDPSMEVAQKVAAQLGNASVEPLTWKSTQDIVVGLESK